MEGNGGKTKMKILQIKRAAVRKFHRRIAGALCVWGVLAPGIWGIAFAAAVTADDFLPPVQATTPEQKEELLVVKEKNAVKTEVDTDLGLPVTRGGSLQDAINKIVEKPKQGCHLAQVRPEDGIVFVATGQGSYNPAHANVVASRIEQRNAYLEAFVNAKAELARTTGDLAYRGAIDFDKKTERLDTSDKGLTNIEKDLSESQKQSVSKVLKGYVTYAVHDDGAGKVFVTIVSSPKTRGQYNRGGSDGLTAANLRDGLNTVLADIRSGIVPPVGGRIIEVSATGEIAFVGFGSSVVRKDEEPDVQAELDLQAEQVAELRAIDALAGIILGDDTRWEGHADEATSKQVKDFQRMEQSVPLGQGTQGEVQEYQKRVKDMRNSLSSSTSVKTLREGKLPPGIMRQSYIDDNAYFAYGIAVYVPSLTEDVRKGIEEMDKTQIVQPSQQRGKGSSPTPSGSPKQENLDMRKGPSGVVQQTL
jgi:hypothetical protein